MSVLIKGMKMPKHCIECVFYRAYSQDYDYCCISSAIPKGYVPADCPLVPVPYHGDLIDRDDIRKQIPSEELSSRFAIENAYVVIPAERSEE